MYYRCKPTQKHYNEMELVDDNVWPPSNIANTTMILTLNQIINATSANNCANMFRNNTSFSSAVMIGPDVVDCSNMFCDARNFNNYIFPFDYLTYGYDNKKSLNCSNMFKNCYNLNIDGADNKHILLGIGVTNLSYCFANCSNFNGYVAYNINNNVEEVDASYAFYNCTKLEHTTGTYGINGNGFVSIGKNVNCSHMFDGCKSLVRVDGISTDATSTYFPYVKNIDYYFSGCTNFNFNVSVGTTMSYYTSCRGIYNGCSSLDQLITFTTNITDCSYAFQGCSSLTKKIVIPSSVTNASYMFANCSNLNQNIAIPTSVTDCSGMFMGCNKLQQSIAVTANVTNTAYMFSNCAIFSKAVTIPAKVTNTAYMYANSVKYNVNVVIPANVTNCYEMFNNCTAFGGTGRKISININTSQTTHDFRNLLKQKSNSLRVNIFCNNLSLLNGTTAATSITGTDITWASQTNGYKNTVYNIYLYKNYTGKT